MNEVARSFSIGTAAAGLLVTLTQVGYGLGLAVIVPLGDLLPRRRLVVVVFLASAVAMAISAIAHSYGLFAILAVIVGLTSVGGQILIPFSADLSSPERRARTVAVLMSGLLMGISLSRTVSGVVAQLAGWRSVYYGAAALMALEALVLVWLLPQERPRPHASLSDTLLGGIRLMRQLPQLRRRGLAGALAMATFSALWTTIAFHLSASPFHLSQAAIGAFGLLGVAGVVAANAAGRLSDQHRQKWSSFVAALLMLVGYAALLMGASNIVVIALGIFELDAGVQGMQVTKQSVIYALAPDARSRITSAYMVMYFAGGAAGSGFAGWIYAAHGWQGACWFGIALGGASVAIALLVPPELSVRSGQDLGHL